MQKNISNNFIKAPFTLENLDLFYVRNSIFNELKTSISKFDNNLLDIACGKMPYKDFIIQNSNVKSYTGLDIDTALVYDENVKPDFIWNGITMPFESNKFDCAIGTEVLEHCPEPERILSETFRVLKKGGIFFFTVPFLWPLHEVPHDEYRYTPWSLERHLANSGFRDIELKSLGGWHASMAQMLGLWVRRAPMTDSKRKWLSKLLKPVIKRLINVEKYSQAGFHESHMITGLSGVAYK